MTEETLFARALEKFPGVERQAYLDAACGDDRQLRERVERLLHADERSRGILEQAPVADLADELLDTASLNRPADSTPFPDESPSARETNPPGYALAERVGEGGMGVVYRARDTRLHRDVAVKFLRPLYAADGPAAHRFVVEARITARLQHPGVPPIHQAGALSDGRPFLAMKLIQGRTLDDLLRVRSDSAHDRGRFLAIFEAVCQAVGYAHSEGVIHRDLKPSNIMVGPFGEVQVMDWGLAKVLDSAAGPGDQETTTEAPTPSAVDADRLDHGGSTRTGSVLGTPAYMPPEQATGAVERVDRRSDVFGLGAILCTILTGKPPYVGTGSETTRQMAAQAKLGDAQSRLDECGADPGMVELCKRCLAAELTVRPADAGEVAQAVADLRAAADERARTAELDRVRADGERAKVQSEAREQRKRRRVQLALAAAVGLLLAAGGMFAWYTDRQAAKQRAEEEWRDRDEKARRERNAESVAALLGQCEEALRADQADRASIALDAAERRVTEGGAEDMAGRLACCRADLALLHALDDADTYRWTWFGRALPEPRAVIDRWRVALAEFGVTLDDNRAGDVAGCVNRSLIRDRVLTALDLWLAAKPSAGARPGVRAVLCLADPDPYRESVRDAVAARDNSAIAALAGRPEAMVQPARFAVVLGQLPGVPAERGRVVFKNALRTRPGDLHLLMALGTSFPANQPQGAGESVRWFQAAVAAHPRNVAARNCLGYVLRVKGDRDGAISAYRDATRLDPKFAIAHHNLGYALWEKGEREEAIAAFRDAILADPEYRDAYFKLGGALWEKGDRDGAIVAFREAVLRHPKDASARSNLGFVLQGTGDWDGAFAEYEEALRLDPNHDLVHSNLAVLLATGPDRMRDGKRAVEHGTRACELAGWKQPGGLASLAVAYAEVENFDKAVEYQTKALSFPEYEKKYGAVARERLQLYIQKKPYRDPNFARCELAPRPRTIKQ